MPRRSRRSVDRVAAAVVALAAVVAAPAGAVHAAPTAVPAAAPGPGGSVSWAPAGRQVLGRPVLYTGSANGAFVAWMDPAAHPPGRGPRHRRPARLALGWPGRTRPAAVPRLVVQRRLQVGRHRRRRPRVRCVVPRPVAGEASFIVYADGTYTVGAWGRDNDPAKPVVGLRQNLGLLVDGGAPTPAASNPGTWGASVAGVATARGGVGVDANGGLVWAGGRLSPLDLANALATAGAVRGMEMDINPDWVNFNVVRRRARQRRPRARSLRGGGRRSLPAPRRPRLHRHVRARHRGRRCHRQAGRTAVGGPREGEVAAQPIAKPGCVPVDNIPRNPPSTQSASPVT